MADLRIDEDDLRRLLEERDRLKAHVGELQTACSRHEREARIARARADYWEAAYSNATCGGPQDAEELQSAWDALRAYGIDMHGDPILKAREPKAPEPAHDQVEEDDGEAE